MIAPKLYKKLSISPEGCIEEKTFYVSGRQIPLFDIRKQLLEDHEKKELVRDHSEQKYARLTNEQVVEQLKILAEYNIDKDYTSEELKDKLKAVERTRHLIVWSDHSCLKNHGHLLLTVNCIYDPAFFYTREELQMRTGDDVDVGAIVQTPQLYNLGRCSDKLCDHLCYIETRMNDVQALSNSTKSSHGIDVHDKMRFLHSDHPEQASETGQQEGAYHH